MKRFFTILILMLSVFSIANAHPFKSDKELYDFYAEIDKKIFAEKNKPIVRKKFPRKLTKEEESKVPLDNRNYTVEEVIGNDKLVYSAFDNHLMYIFQLNQKGKEEGVVRFFDEDENLVKICYGNDLNGLMGILREYYPNGKLKNEMPYYAKKLNGNGKIYYESGALREDYHYYNDKEDGQGIIYFENGQKMQVENYKNGLKVGDYYEYFEDGTLATKGFFVNGKEEGVFELYNREGKKFKELIFKKGKKIEEREIKQ